MDTVRKVRVWNAVRIGAEVAVIAILLGYIVRVELFASQTRNSICEFVQDLDRRILAGEAILDANPGTGPIYGIDRNVIVDGLRNQQRTFKALSGLECARAVDVDG